MWGYFRGFFIRVILVRWVFMVGEGEGVDIYGYEEIFGAMKIFFILIMLVFI